ncbi:MAG: VanZ family protein [Alphaproteobacteria bacterium]|nr:VanZ family protein [Alphaproteobacteria bacterium]
MDARFKKALPFFAIAAIVVLSLVPGQMQVRTGASRHLEHFAAYFAVAGLLALVWGRAPLALFGIGVLLMALAAAMELAQILVPGRTARLSDLAASDLGIACGLVAMWILLRLLPLMNRALAPRRGTEP